MKIAIQTLGCKVNQYESQALELLLVERGHSLVSPEEVADAYIVNSCTVTATSDKKSRQAVRQAKKRNPQAVVALCGCYSQVSTPKAQELGLDLIGGTGDREQFLDLLEQVFIEKTALIHVDNPQDRKNFEMLPGGGLRDRTRAMLKVEDGCTNFCSYCIIPYARGPVRSLPLAAAVEEAQRLAALGYREMVLTGIEISSWGRDLSGEETLIDLVEAVCRAAPGCRIRLGSLEPRTITQEFCRRLAALENLQPHFHLSLQSGCDETLQRMKRRYDTKRYMESVELLRSYFQNPGVTTDLIVGFPGETPEEFEKTLDSIRQCQFSSMHIFPYSKREGTPAAKLPGQIGNEEKGRRAKMAAALGTEMEKTYLNRLLGEVRPVLFETERNGVFRGYLPEYVPVEAAGTGLQNEIRQVRLDGIEENTAGEVYVHGTVL